MKEIVKQLLLNTKRDGMEKLIDYMELKGFFTSPASTKYHLACNGGLMNHSYSLYILFKKMCYVTFLSSYIDLTLLPL